MMDLQIFLWIYIAITSVFLLADVIIKRRMAVWPQKEKRIIAYWRTEFEKYLASGSYAFSQKNLFLMRLSDWLQGFYGAYNSLYVQNPKVKDLVEANEREIFQVCSRYSRHNTIMRAYFAYFCSGLDINDPKDNNEYTKLMLNYLSDPSVYSHENALKALCSFGNVDSIVEAFQIMTSHNIYHKEKLITNNLLLFAGDTEELTEALMVHFSEFSKCCRIGIVDFLRYQKNVKYDDRMQAVVCNPSEDTDLRCCCIRLLTDHKYPAFYKAIDQLLKDYDNPNWELTAVAAKAAGNLDKQYVEKPLMKALTSKYWYVRVNSARSLVKLPIAKEDLDAIVNGRDEFARDALLYELEKKEEGTCIR